MYLMGDHLVARSCAYHPTKKQFAIAILKFFRETIQNEWKTFRSQVSDNFRVITHEKTSGFAVAAV
jgi:hypothetical protein